MHSAQEQLTQEQETIGKQHIWDGWLSIEWQLQGTKLETNKIAQI